MLQRNSQGQPLDSRHCRVSNEQIRRDQRRDFKRSAFIGGCNCREAGIREDFGLGCGDCLFVANKENRWPLPRCIESRQVLLHSTAAIGECVCKPKSPRFERIADSTVRKPAACTRKNTKSQLRRLQEPELHGLAFRRARSRGMTKGGGRTQGLPRITTSDRTGCLE